MPEAEERVLRTCWATCWRPAQKAGPCGGMSTCWTTKAILVGAQAMQAYDHDAAERLTEVVLDGLRAR